MTNGFHKFPHTPHLVWLGAGSPRDDKVLNPADVTEFLSGEVIVEEKVDGANMGISLGPDGRVRAQSRGNYLASGRSHSQWNLLWPWLAERRDILENGLGGGLMLFGEWCYARHTVPYDALPDWFLGFDIFELGSGRFWSVDRRNTWMREHGLVSVPEVKRGRIQLKQVSSFLARSVVGHAPMEGIYLRRDNGKWLESRAKVVSAAFNQQIEEHWTRRSVVPNQLAMAHV
jgi:ATP-dependent RNA circularization protein (DNA/RNA ligase family)